MRILAFPGVSASTVFSLAALLRAARHAGHEVMIATNPEVAEAAAGIGIPSTVVTTMTWQEAVFRGRDGSALEPPEDVHGRREYVGHMFGRFAASTLAGIGDLVRSWRPTVTLGCPLAFSAPVLAAELGIPVSGSRGTPVTRPGRRRSVRTSSSRPSSAVLACTRCPTPICGWRSLRRACCQPTSRPGCR